MKGAQVCLITNSELSRTHKRKSIPDVLTGCEQKLLLSAANQRAPSGYRNYAILTVFLNTGIRLSELINLKKKDVDLKSGKIHIRQGKGDKDRVLWICSKDRAVIKKWLEKRPVDSEHLFCTLKGGPLNDRYVRDFIKRYAKEKNIQKRVYPHMLRHTFATDLYGKSKNIRLVQKALGHSSLLTTMIYTHIVDSEMESAMIGLRTEEPPAGNEES